MTVGGSTSGSMKTASSTRLPGKRRRANSQPSAMPATSASEVATPATRNDSHNGDQSIQ